MRVIGDFEIIYFVGGIGHIVIEDTEYVCKKGDIILIRPYEEHSIQSSRTEPYDNYYVHFDISPAMYRQDFISDLFPDFRRKSTLV